MLFAGKRTALALLSVQVPFEFVYPVGQAFWTSNAWPVPLAQIGLLEPLNCEPVPFPA